MKTMFGKFTLMAVLFALLLTALPAQTAQAAGANDPVTPPAGVTPDPAMTNVRLERAFLRQKNNVERLAFTFENVDTVIARAEEALAKAAANGKDVTALQKAIDDFKAALEKAEPLYEDAQAIADAADGFDAEGKVTDAETAKETVQALGEALKAVRETLGESFKALRDALRDFRQDNSRPTATPKP